MKNKKHIKFDPVKHTYTNTNTKELYTSVTNKIGKYVPKFIADQSKTKFTQDKLGLSHQQVVDMWDLKNKQSQIRGNIVHSAIEDYLNGMSYHTVLKSVEEKLVSVPTHILNKQEVAVYLSYIVNKKIRRKNFITEDLLYSDKHKISGQSDLVMFHHNKVWIIDWKTNQKPLTFEGYKDEKMLPPFEYCQAGKLTVYQIQLSTYAWLAQQEYGVPIGGIMLVHFQNIENIKEHVLKYNPDYVARLLQNNPDFITNNK